MRINTGTDNVEIKKEPMCNQQKAHDFNIDIVRF